MIKIWIITEDISVKKRLNFSLIILWVIEATTTPRPKKDKEKPINVSLKFFNFKSIANVDIKKLEPSANEKIINEYFKIFFIYFCLNILLIRLLKCLFKWH